MRKVYALLAVIIALGILAWVASDNTVVATPPPLKHVGNFSLPGVEGRFDHMAADVQGLRLFVAALGNNTVEVLSLKNGQRLKTLTGLRQPQGILYLPAANRLVVSCAADGTCKIFDGSTYALLHTAKFDLDADNMRYDPASGKVYVGYGEGALGVLDPVSGIVDTAETIPLASHPESFAIETLGRRIFVNVPEMQQIRVADRATDIAPIVRPLDEIASKNYPMALDEPHHRLFVGCRELACVLVMDTDRGIFVANLPCVPDADDIFYDELHRQIYVSGGAGYVTTIAQRDSNTYEELPRINTADGGRTSLYVPELGKLYVAIPKTDGRTAMIKVYEVE